MSKELNEYVKKKMQVIAKKVDDELPEGYGFVVLAFNFGETEGKKMLYVSNANRDNIVEAMKEWIKKTENNFGNDTGKY